MRKQGGRIAVVGSSTLLLALGLPATLSASTLGKPIDDGPPPVLSPAEQYQATIDDYKTRLLNTAADHASYSGAVLDTTSHRLVVQGTIDEPPADVARLMAQAPANLSVSWKSVPYSRAELDQQSNMAMDNLDVMAAQFEDDYSGIVIFVAADDRASAQRIGHSVRASGDSDVPVRVRIFDEEKQGVSPGVGSTTDVESRGGRTSTVKPAKWVAL